MSKHALVIGATGAVGSALTRVLLASPAWRGVKILTRKPTELFAGLAGAEKLSRIAVDMEHVELAAREAGRGCDAAFCTMGIGQPRKLTKEEVWKVEVDQTEAFAKGCKEAGVRHYTLMTAVGANPASKNSYLKLKGTIEERTAALGFERLSFFRPSLLVTRELRYGFQDWLTQTLFPAVAWLLPSRFHGIRVEDLGKAMARNAERSGPPLERLHYEEFIRITG